MLQERSFLKRTGKPVSELASVRQASCRDPADAAAGRGFGMGTGNKDEARGATVSREAKTEWARWLIDG